MAEVRATRYGKRAEKAVGLRAPEMRGAIPASPSRHTSTPSNPDSGAYGGMSFVIFPVDDGPCLVAMVIGTQGLAPDDAILGRPGFGASRIFFIAGGTITIKNLTLTGGSAPADQGEWLRWRRRRR